MPARSHVSLPLADESPTKEEGKKDEAEGAEPPKEEPVKAKPVDYHTVKAGWVQRRGVLGSTSDWVDTSLSCISCFMSLLLHPSTMSAAFPMLVLAIACGIPQIYNSEAATHTHTQDGY